MFLFSFFVLFGSYFSGLLLVRNSRSRQQCATTAVNMLFMSDFSSTLLAHTHTHTYSFVCCEAFVTMCYFFPRSHFSHKIQTFLKCLAYPWIHCSKCTHTHTHSLWHRPAKLMKFASKCNAVNTYEFVKGASEYSIDVYSMTVESKQKPSDSPYIPLEKLRFLEWEA